MSRIITLSQNNEKCLKMFRVRVFCERGRCSQIGWHRDAQQKNFVKGELTTERGK